MTAAEFIETLKFLKLNQTEVARLLRVSPRSVRRWVAEDSDIPGPVAVALETFVLAGIPRAMPSRPMGWTRPPQRFRSLIDMFGPNYLYELAQKDGMS